MKTDLIKDRLLLLVTGFICAALVLLSFRYLGVDNLIYTFLALTLLGLALDNRRLRHLLALPPAERPTMADVERLARAGNRIEAIRVYREIHNVGLAAAKQAVENLPVAV